MAGARVPCAQTANSKIVGGQKAAENVAANLSLLVRSTGLDSTGRKSGYEKRWLGVNNHTSSSALSRDS